MSDFTCSGHVRSLLCAESVAKTNGAQQNGAQQQNGDMLLPKRLEWNEVLLLLSKVELLKHLPEEERVNLAKVCMQHTYRPGDILIRQGDVGDKLFVIVKGSVAVVVNGQKVAELSAGDAVGERALLRDEPRGATICSQTPLTVLGLTREKFQALGLRDKLDFKKREGIAPEMMGSLYKRPPTKKTDLERNALKQALMNNENLLSMVPLSEDQCDTMADLAWEEKYLPTNHVITQGDPGNYFYVVKGGTFTVTVTGPNKELIFSSEITVGGSFGELALIYGAPRAATVKAKDTATVWVIDRDTFKDVFESEANNQAGKLEEALSGSPYFNDLQKEQKVELIKNMQDCHFEKDDIIYEQGDESDAFYILFDGEISIYKKNQDNLEEKVGMLRGSHSKPVVFGELGRWEDAVHLATMRVASETASLLKMEKKAYLKYKTVSPSALKTRRSGKRHPTLTRISLSANVPELKEPIKKDQLTKIGILGCGGFGVVHLVEHETTKNEYALKGISRGFIQKCKMEHAVMREKTIQLLCDSKFVVKLFETYIDDENLYFLMEVVLGGELFDIYRRNGLHGSVEHARYYAAGVVLAFEHMHEKQIMYRDLKPENLLLTERGKLKVTDLGLAKITMGKTNTTCGTPCYFAPEMLQKRGYSLSLDWWTLGILIFELMTGITPFGDGAEALPNIRKGIKTVKFPFNTKGDCEDIIKSLCDANPILRLPMKKGGSGNIKKHPWYTGFDWKKLEEDELDGPFIPEPVSREKIKAKKIPKGDLPTQTPYEPTMDPCGCCPFLCGGEREPPWEEDFPTTKDK
mmetsp:Transcript_46818/g.74732  ORF Transcript_46818/g.74732 Transcript_46818/m.74732 type:complete len:806 (+) Transcript_46818:110-2527(+)